MSEAYSYIQQLKTEYEAGKNAVGSVREAIDAAKPQGNDDFTADQLADAYKQELQKFSSAFKNMTTAEMRATISNLEGKNKEEYILALGEANYRKLLNVLRAKIPYGSSSVRMPVATAK